MFFTTLTSMALAQKVSGTVYSDDDHEYWFQVQLTFEQTVNHNYISAIDIPTPQYLVWRNSSETAVSGFDNIQFDVSQYSKSVTFDTYDRIKTATSTPLSISSGTIAFIHSHFPYSNGFVLNYNGRNVSRMVYRGYKDGVWYTLKQTSSTSSGNPQDLSLEVSQDEAESWFGTYTQYMALVYLGSGYIGGGIESSMGFTFSTLDYSGYFNTVIDNQQDILDAMNFSDQNTSDISDANDSISDSVVSYDDSNVSEALENDQAMEDIFDSYLDQANESSQDITSRAFNVSTILTPLTNLSTMFDTWFSHLDDIQIIIWLSFLFIIIEAILVRRSKDDD